VYTHCHLCARSLSANDVLAHLRVGRRVAYDVERGRLWVVCPRCAEWNLAPLDARWEAIEECERVFASAEVRASDAGVGLARTRGLELVRVGPAMRDELANWRYGPRLRRRHRRTAVALSVAGVIAGGFVGAAALAVVTAKSVWMFTTWGAAVVASYGAALLRRVERRVGPRRDIRFTSARGDDVRLPHAALKAIRLDGASRRSGVTRVDVLHDAPPAAFDREGTLLLLHEVLPRLNWRGATRAEVAAATRIVDEAEAAVAAPRADGEPSPAAWERIAVAHWRSVVALHAMEPVARLALEMAVTEELERRAVAGEAAALVASWERAEEVAGIADGMFVPRFVSEWIARRRGAPSAAIAPGAPE